MRCIKLVAISAALVCVCCSCSSNSSSSKAIIHNETSNLEIKGQDELESRYRDLADKVVTSLSSGVMDDSIAYDGYKDTIATIDYSDTKYYIEEYTFAMYGDLDELEEGYEDIYRANEPDSSIIRYDSDGKAYILISDLIDHKDDGHIEIVYKGWKFDFPFGNFDSQRYWDKLIGNVYEYRFYEKQSSSISLLYKSVGDNQTIIVKELIDESGDIKDIDIELSGWNAGDEYNE